jgi:hypothetical protein
MLSFEKSNILFKVFFIQLVKFSLKFIHLMQVFVFHSFNLLLNLGNLFGQCFYSIN